MSRERAEKERLSSTLAVNAGVEIPSGLEGTVNDPRLGGVNIPPIHRDEVNPPGTDKVIEKAERQAEKSRRTGSNELEVPDRSILAVRSPGDPASGEQITLPVIGEAHETSSNVSGVTPSPSYEDIRASHNRPILGNANMPSDSIGEIPPPTPPKLDGSIDTRDAAERQSWGGRPPPTPPKDGPRSQGLADIAQNNKHYSSDKELPLPPPMHKASTQLSASPMSISPLVSDEEMRHLGLRGS